MLTATIFLIAYFSACALALVRHPVFGLLAYVAAYFIHPPSQWWSYAAPNLRWSLFAAVVTLVAVVIHHSKLTPRSFLKNGVIIALFLFVAWLVVQSLWALNPPMHAELLNYYAKYAIVVGLIYKSIENESHLKMFLWMHVVGCFYFGWYAFFMYDGGRFGAFQGPGFGDANFAGLQAVAGILAAAGLFLAGRFWERVLIFLMVPFIVNGLITTVSRSSFLALLVGGLVFVLLSPRRYRAPAIALGVVGLIGFAVLTHDQYWERIGTIRHVGEQVEGTDTGANRLVVWKAQERMFAAHPLGCGHRCTATLSPYYLDDHYLTGPPGSRARSSHNTYLTLLVEQGIVGGIFVLLFLIWLIRVSLRLKKFVRSHAGILPVVYPSAVGILAAILVADVFVDYLKMEVRLWYIAMLLVILELARQSSSVSESTLPATRRCEDHGRKIKARQVSREARKSHL